MILVGCGDGGGPETSTQGCEQTEVFAEFWRDFDPDSIDPYDHVAVSTARVGYASNMEQWLEAVPPSIRDAWERYDSIDANTRNLDEREEAEAAYDEVQRWAREVCRVDGF